MIQQVSYPASGDEAANRIRLLIDAVNDQEQRIAALEAAAQPTNNDDLIAKIKDAHNAMEKVIAHFRRTAAENKNV
jgi:hypothetical protein